MVISSQQTQHGTGQNGLVVDLCFLFLYFSFPTSCVKNSRSSVAYWAGAWKQCLLDLTHSAYLVLYTFAFITGREAYICYTWEGRAAGLCFLYESSKIIRGLLVWSIVTRYIHIIRRIITLSPSFASSLRVPDNHVGMDHHVVLEFLPFDLCDPMHWAWPSVSDIEPFR